MNELRVFENKEFGAIQTVIIENEPWLVGKDVCIAFGDTNYRRSLSRLDKEEKTTCLIETKGGRQKAVVVNESGLYSLLFYMQPQKAKGVSQNAILIEERISKLKKFKRWVTSEVLPAIRKHGMYATDELIANPDIAIAAFQALKDEREQRKRLELENSRQKQIIGELKPRADYTDIILQSKSLVTITQIAKDYGMSGSAMNALLHKYGVQFKQSGQWLLYAKYHNNGFTHSETVQITHNDGRSDTKMNTKWAQKGRLFIYNLLKSHEILPLIEADMTA